MRGWNTGFFTEEVAGTLRPFKCREEPFQRTSSPAESWRLAGSGPLMERTLVETNQAKVSSDTVTALHWAEDEEDEGKNRWSSAKERHVGQVKGNDAQEWDGDGEAAGWKWQRWPTCRLGGGSRDTLGTMRRGRRAESPRGRERGVFCPGPSTAAHTGRGTLLFSFQFSFFF